MEQYYQNVAQKLKGCLKVSEEKGFAKHASSLIGNHQTTYNIEFSYSGYSIEFINLLGVQDVGSVTIKKQRAHFEGFQFKTQTFLEKLFTRNSLRGKVISKNQQLAAALNASLEFSQLEHFFDDLNFEPFIEIKKNNTIDAEFMFKYSLAIDNYISVIIPIINFLKKYIDIIERS